MIKKTLLHTLIEFNVIMKNNKINKRARYLVNKHKDHIQNQIIEHTSFLDSNADLIERLYCIKSNITSSPRCLHCGVVLKFKTDISRYDFYCSLKCSNNSVDCKNKKINTWIAHYGVSNPSQNQSIKNKKIKTSLIKFGTYHPKQRHISDESMSNLKNSEWMEKQHHILKKSLVTISKELGVSDDMTGRYLHSHNLVTQRHITSDKEQQLAEFIKSLLPNSEVLTSVRNIIAPQELDIYIPSLNIAIEFDGLYWHSELQGKDRKYHLNKTTECEKKGIRLIHIFENEWVNRQDVVKARLMNILQQNTTKIYARKCVINDVVSAPATRAFMNENHIQGYTPSSVNLALMHDNEIVAMMTLGKSRFNKAIQYELIRFVVKKGYSIVGGASKLFNYFVKSFNPTSIITYSDKRWNTGNLYATLGFTYTHTAAPNYFYFKEGNYQLWSRVHFQKHKLEKQLKVFNPEKTEWENMVIDGYNRIWDCGNDVYSWKNTPLL